MNHIFSIVWSPARRAWRVANEHAASHGKGAAGRKTRLKRSLADLAGAIRGVGLDWSVPTSVRGGGRLAALSVALLASAPAWSQALPTGGQVVAGQGNIGAAEGGKLAIDQLSRHMAIDWQEFNIGAGNTVVFQQPGRDAVALNRVLGPDASRIMGQLQANGRVFLVNPHGVLFGQNAKVDVGGLVASTLNIGNADFMAGNYRFQGNGNPAAVVNQGRIRAADGGAVALLGGQVHNQGIVQARMGTVALAAGNAVTLDFAGDGLLNVQVDQAAKNALVDNGQLIQADGGQVLMTASASDALLQTVVNNTGVVEARTLQNRSGKILLLGDFSGGTVKVGGKLDASAPDGGDGGFIDTSGAQVQVAAGARVTTLAPQGKTGTWLIDPTDFTISAGSNPETPSGIGADTLASNLELGGVTLSTAPSGGEPGDIHVNASVHWNAATTLMLNAHNDINIKAPITSDAGSVVANAQRDINIDRLINTTTGSVEVDAGRDLNINASITSMADFVDAKAGRDVNIKASIITMLGNIYVDAQRDVNIRAPISTMEGDIDIAAQRDININDSITTMGSILASAVYGDLRIAPGVSIAAGDPLGVDGYAAFTAGESIIIDGEVMAYGTGSSISMLGSEISVGKNLSVVGDAGQINLDSWGKLIIDADVSVKGHGGAITLIGGDAALINGKVNVIGDSGQIELKTCSPCDPNEGDIAINNEVATLGDDGFVFVDAAGGISLNGKVSAGEGNASYVALLAERDISSTAEGMIEASQLEVASRQGSVLLDQGEHRVETLRAVVNNDLRFVNGQDLYVADADVAADGNVLIQTAMGDLILGGTVVIGGKGDIDLVTAGAFLNGAGPDALRASDGNWRVWSQNPANDDLCCLAYDFKQYNAQYGSSTVLGQGNGVLYALAPVVKVGLQGSISKVYDGTVAAAVDASNYGAPTGVLEGDEVVFSTPAQGRYGDRNAGTGKTVTIDGIQIQKAFEADSGVPIYGYQIEASANIGRIDPRAVTVRADDQTKRIYQADPALTWRIVQGGLVEGDILSGAPARDPGEAPGVYAIRRGDLSGGGNYVLDFVDGKLVVLLATLDDYLGDQAAAYQSAIVSAQNLRQGPTAFDRNPRGEGAPGPVSGPAQGQAPYTIVNEGLRMPEGI